jgi:hypothetical protein
LTITAAAAMPRRFFCRHGGGERVVGMSNNTVRHFFAVFRVSDVAFC